MLRDNGYQKDTYKGCQAVKSVVWAAGSLDILWQRVQIPDPSLSGPTDNAQPLQEPAFIDAHLGLCSRLCSCGRTDR